MTAVLLFQTFLPTLIVLHGSFFVSDAGRSHGGFEYNGEWNATLTIRGSTGTLKLVLNVGLGDALKKHEYTITEFNKEPNKITMKIEEQPLVLIWVGNDVVWNHV